MLENAHLHINFGESLHLLPFQDIISLLKTCKNDRKTEVIRLIGVDSDYKNKGGKKTKKHVIDWEKSIERSASLNIDPRVTKHAINSQGKPLIMEFCDLSFENSITARKNHELLLISLLKQHLDVNLREQITGL